MANGNRGKLSLMIRTVEGSPAADPDTRIEVLRSNGVRILQFPQLVFPLNAHLDLPAFPQESNLRFDVTPERYRGFFTQFFTLFSDTPQTVEVIAMRDPKKWTAAFTPWSGLPVTFAPLQSVLEGSDLNVIGGDQLGQFTEAIYDGVQGEKTTLAKASLLNLYAVLERTIEPVDGTRSWFSHVDRLMFIDRERFYAVVDGGMEDVVNTIKADIKNFDGYKHTAAENHFKKLQNTFSDFQIFKSKMRSIKTTDKHGNLQLTVAPAKDENGANVLLLDADLDENSAIAHFIDAFLVHPFSGGTHPFDIHEYLIAADPRRTLGYDLV